LKVESDSSKLPIGRSTEFMRSVLELLSINRSGNRQNSWRAGRPAGSLLYDGRCLTTEGTVVIVQRRMTAVGNVRLAGRDDSYVIASDFWSEILDWAEDNGWSPEYEPICYRGDMDLEVGLDDANNLADALEFIAGDVVLHEYEVPDQFLRHLLNSLAKLELFFRAGSFRIVPVPKSSF
jgi:hypothetical protein